MTKLLETAEQIARQAHDGQHEKSTGDDYIRHVERVVALVEDDEAKAVAWLHDVLEDSPWTEYDLLDKDISRRVFDAVRLLTRVHQSAVTYAAYIERIYTSGDTLAVRVKIADLQDHLRPNCPTRLRPRYEAALARLTGVTP
jgi:(p)ppGpp synthase/HD superfamily hydrolase